MILEIGENPQGVEISFCEVIQAAAESIDSDNICLDLLEILQTDVRLSEQLHLNNASPSV